MGRRRWRKDQGSFGNPGGLAASDPVARLVDNPGAGLPVTGANNRRDVRVAKFFETAVICIDTGEILGTVAWGFVVPANKKEPIILFPVTFLSEPSSTFRDAVQLANKTRTLSTRLRHPLARCLAAHLHCRKGAYRGWKMSDLGSRSDNDLDLWMRWDDVSLAGGGVPLARGGKF